LTQPDEVRVFKISVDSLTVSGLRFRDLLDIAEVTGLDVLDLAPILEKRKGSGVDKLKAVAGFTWIAQRRNEPGLTYDDVLDGRIEIEKDTDNSQSNPTLQTPETQF
jgi:hypothetical protein